MQTDTDQNQRGLRLLAFDDGGIRGLSGLYILQEIMFRLMHLENSQSMPKPCDYFDIIGGVGTGGVIALMLGRLGMTIDQAINEYASFSKNVYSNVKTWSTSQEKFKASIFVSEMEKVLISAGFPIDISMQDQTFCRSFVVALPSANMTPRIFRTYQVRANPGYNCTVVEAARATTATPELFKPVVITAQGVSETFIGARLGYSNPTSVVLDEAKLVFGLSQQVVCLVSIGAGHPGPVSWNPTKQFNKRLVNLLFQRSANYEAPAEELVKRYLHLPGVFYRLSVEQGLQAIVDDYNQLGVIKAHSLDYLKKAEVSQKVDDLVYALHDCSPKVTLGVLMGHVLPEQISPSDSLLPIVPAPSPLFTGREDILAKLEDYFCNDEPSLKTRAQKCFVLYGLGGTGKTQIVLKFVHEFGSRFSSTYMIDASSKATIEQFFKLLAQKAKLADLTSTGQLQQQVVQAKKEAFGSSHPDTIEAMANLAATFHFCGQLEEAKELRQHVLKVRTEAFESDHPLIMKAMANLSATLYLNGQLKEARELMQHVLEVRTKAFGINHLETIKAAGDLAVMLYSSGQVEESKRLEEQVLKFKTETFGSSHPETIQAMANFAASLSTSGQLEEAKQLEQQVLKARTEAFGTNHPDTIQAMNNLAVTFHSSRQLEQAKELMQQVLEARKEAFGSGHPDTIEAMANLAAVLAGSGQLGQDEQARELRQQVLELRTEAFGSKHPLTIEAMASLAVSLKTSGHLEEGKELEQQVLKARTEIFGSSHPDTIQAMAYLAMTLHAIGQLEEAKKLNEHGSISEQKHLESAIQILSKPWPPLL
ncbi:Nephrocystin-3 [Termitomyces sp. T112]|nr:Nephrocystin-3 [Termitomyces sp. T112]